VVWADPAEFRERSFRAQGDLRFQLFRADADLVILCDADTVLMRPLSELAGLLADRPALAGVIAHYPFPWTGSMGDSAGDWKTLARSVLGREIPLLHRYSLQDFDRSDMCPFYINYGFFAGTPGLMSRFFQVYRDLLPEVKVVLGNYFDGQVALALAIAQLELPTIALPMRYNFPNDRRADALYPHERERMVLLHYLRTQHFDRQVIFTGEEHFQRFLGMDLQGSDADFQACVRTLTGGHYPFARE
jgi:hypothetical protein